ncbi:MAG: group II intron reverse transcriptase/maturase [Solirubrobacterales bacterium]
MRRGKAMHQKSEQLECSELLPRGWGDSSSATQSGEAGRATHDTERSGATRLSMSDLMEQAVARENAMAAFQRVRRNKGSPGIDGMTVDQLEPYLREHWAVIREQLLAGGYQPSAVKRREIPKSDGGVRGLGIPTVLDRFVQQLLLQVLQPIFDPTFSKHSHGFRPGRRAHDGVRAAQRYLQGGRQWVVDVDLEKFFDRVNHDVLMGKLQNRIDDPRVLGLIRRYLVAGIMVNGVVMERHEGTPQGGPLSPLLANVLLDDVDKELEQRGHRFARYADDCNVYVQSRRAGEDVLALLRVLYAKLRLRINEAKSAVALAWDRKFLGYSFAVARDGTVRYRVAAKALEELKHQVRQITRRSGGRSLTQVARDLRSYLRGWKQYFHLAEMPQIFRALDGWIHRRLRALQLKQWRHGRTSRRALRARGLPEWLVQQGGGHGRRWWRASTLSALHTALPGSYFDRLGVPRLARLTSTL